MAEGVIWQFHEPESLEEAIEVSTSDGPWRRAHADEGWVRHNAAGGRWGILTVLPGHPSARDLRDLIGSIAGAEPVSLQPDSPRSFLTPALDR